MSEEIELNGQIYKKFGGEWHDATFIRVPQAIARELDVLARRKEENATISLAEAATEPAKKKSRSSSQESAFSEEEVSPIIAGVIREQYAESGDFIKHRDLVKALLEHPKMAQQIDGAVEKRGHSRKQWASWMVQSFSAAMTADRSDFEDAFERERIDDQWAYKPADA